MEKVDKDLNYLGKKLILSCIKTDEALADLLKIEIKNLKKNVAKNGSIYDIQKSHILLRNIIIALTITQEKIDTGINLCETSKETKKDKF